MKPARTLASLPATYSWHKSAKTAAAMSSLLRSVARAWNIAYNGGAAAAVTALTADLQRKGKTLTLDEKERLDMLEAASTTENLTASVALAEFVGIRLDPNTKPAAWREGERTLLLARTLPASWSEAEVAEFHAGKRTLDTRCGQLNTTAASRRSGTRKRSETRTR